MSVKQLDDVTTCVKESITLEVEVVNTLTYRCFFFLPLLLVSPEEQMFYIWCLIVYNHNIIMQ